MLYLKHVTAALIRFILDVGSKVCAKDIEFSRWVQTASNQKFFPQINPKIKLPAEIKPFLSEIN